MAQLKLDEKKLYFEQVTAVRVENKSIKERNCERKRRRKADESDVPPLTRPSKLSPCRLQTSLV